MKDYFYLTNNINKHHSPFTTLPIQGIYTVYYTARPINYYQGDTTEGYDMPGLSCVKLSQTRARHPQASDGLNLDQKRKVRDMGLI